MRRLLGVASLGAAAGVVALEIWAVVYILGGFGPLGWLVGAIVLSLWVMFAVPFLMIGVHLLGGDRWRRGLILSPTVPQPSKRDAAAASPPDVHRSNRPAPPCTRTSVTGPALTSGPSALAAVWPTWPDPDEPGSQEYRRAQAIAPVDRSADAQPSSAPRPYGLHPAPAAGVLSLAVIVTTLYLLLAPQ